MVTNYEYGYETNIKDRVAGKASTQITAAELTKANRYASDIINVVTDKFWDISVNQTNGAITSTEPYTNSISAIAEKLAAQSLRASFNEQELKTKLEWQQAMDELMKIKENIAKLGSATSSKTIAGSTPMTFPSNPDASFISGVRKHVERWN